MYKCNTSQAMGTVTDLYHSHITEHIQHQLLAILKVLVGNPYDSAVSIRIPQQIMRDSCGYSVTVIVPP